MPLQPPARSATTRASRVLRRAAPATRALARTLTHIPGGASRGASAAAVQRCNGKHWQQPTTPAPAHPLRRASPAKPASEEQAAPSAKEAAVSAASATRLTPAACCSAVPRLNRYTTNMRPHSTPAMRAITLYCAAGGGRAGGREGRGAVERRQLVGRRQRPQRCWLPGPPVSPGSPLRPPGWPEISAGNGAAGAAEAEGGLFVAAGTEARRHCVGCRRAPRASRISGVPSSRRSTSRAISDATPSIATHVKSTSAITGEGPAQPRNTMSATPLAAPPRTAAGGSRRSWPTCTCERAGCGGGPGGDQAARWAAERALQAHTRGVPAPRQRTRHPRSRQRAERAAPGAAYGPATEPAARAGGAGPPPLPRRPGAPACCRAFQQ